MKLYAFIFLLPLSFSALALPYDPEGATLDHRYSSGPRPEVTHFKSLTTHNDVDTLIQKQTPVKAQGSRSTCSIFSSTAIFEFMLIEQGYSNTDIDLSEEWVQYLSKNFRTVDDSNSRRNFENASIYGVAKESDWNYDGDIWYDATDDLPKERCSHLSDDLLTSCLLGHRDPRLLRARNEDLLNSGSGLFDPDFKAIRDSASTLLTALSSLRGVDFGIYDTGTARDLLDQGIAITVDLDFYFGAWNHPAAEYYEIRERNMEHWKNGIVHFPIQGSKDFEISPSKSVGHSVLLVGYDDSIVIEAEVPMVKGGTQKVTTQGVYLFKNSWGLTSFGETFQYQGKTYPGYGMIPQKYAHYYGSFYHFPLK